MVTKSTNNMLWGNVDLLVDADGTFPVTDIGYKSRDNGVVITFSREQNAKEVAELDGPALLRTIRRGVKVSAILDQFLAGNLAKALGINSGTMLIGGGLYVDDAFEVNVVGTMADDSTPIHLYLPKAITSDDVEISMMRDNSSGIPIAFTALDDDTNGMARWFIGQTTEEEVTLSTGDAARTIVSDTDYEIKRIEVTSETGTSDAMTDITVASGALFDLERIRVQPASGQTITVTHASGVIETKDSENFVMDNAKDWIDLWYDLTNTTWKEITRYAA